MLCEAARCWAVESAVEKQHRWEKDTEKKHSVEILVMMNRRVKSEV